LVQFFRSTEVNAARPVRIRSAFTLVEVLVVLGVIGVIIGLVIPALGSIRAESKSTVCLSNLRQLFTALETSRQQQKDMLPYAAPLPAPVGEVSLVPGLPDRLAGIVKPDNEIWFCPADQSQDSQDIGTSYIYVPGAFMMLEPPLIDPDTGQLELDSMRLQRVVRLITQRFTAGYLRNLPLVTDNDGFHDFGAREPWNGVFMDGHARVGSPRDGAIEPPDPRD
jgi:prepilin-type N-terminal cleavage/methylation domain-containing protein